MSGLPHGVAQVEEFQGAQLKYMLHAGFKCVSYDGPWYMGKTLKVCFQQLT